jgi:hypothetical protein
VEEVASESIRAATLKRQVSHCQAANRLRGGGTNRSNSTATSAIFAHLKVRFGSKHLLRPEVRSQSRMENAQPGVLISSKRHSRAWRDTSGPVPRTVRNRSTDCLQGWSAPRVLRSLATLTAPGRCAARSIAQALRRGGAGRGRLDSQPRKLRLCDYTSPPDTKVTNSVSVIVSGLSVKTPATCILVPARGHSGLPAGAPVNETVGSPNTSDLVPFVQVNLID